MTERRGFPSRFPSWIIPVALAALLLYFSLRGVEWRRVGQIIAGAYWPFLLAALGTAFLSSLGRAVRWRILLNATGAGLGILTVFWAMMAGYLGNLVLPARAGELVRTFLISRNSALTTPYVLTTALGERVMDAIALILFSSLALLGVPSIPAWMLGVARSLAAVAVVAAISVAVLPYIHNWVESVLRRIPMPAKLRDMLLALLSQVMLGLRAFHDPKRFALFAALTPVIWSIDTIGGVLAAHALNLPLNFAQVLLLLTALGLGSALPATPGYLGIFQFVAVTVLGPFGIARDSAIAYVIILQAITSILFITLGALGLIRLGANFATLKDVSRNRQ